MAIHHKKLVHIKHDALSIGFILFEKFLEGEEEEKMIQLRVSMMTTECKYCQNILSVNCICNLK